MSGSVLAISMKAGVKDSVVTEVVIELLVDDLFKNFAEWRQESYRSVVTGLQKTLFFVQRYDLGELPDAGELHLHDGQGYYVVYWSCYKLGSHLD